MKPTYHKLIPRFACAVLLSAAAVCKVYADYQSTMLSLGPIGYWRFDETSPASPPLNVITNASTLGSIANGYCVDYPVKGAAGIVGNCVQFLNASVSSDVGFLGNKIDVPWNAAVNPTPPFSIEFWANPSALSYDSTGMCPLSNFDPNDSGGSRAGWLFYLNSAGTWQFRLGNRGGYAGILTATSGTAVPGTWQHIVVTWDGATATMYANGAQIAQAAISVANWVDNPQSFLRFGGTPLTGDGAEANYIAATSTDGNRGYAGLLEEVAIYNYLLTTNTISAHYTAGEAHSVTYNAMILSNNPSAYWPMNDAAYTPSTPPYPVANNIGSLGSAANGTNFFGTLIGQAGPGYAGFGAGDKSVFFDGDNGYCQITDTPGLHWAVNDGMTTNFITMSAWIKPTEQDFFRDIIAHGWDVNTGDYAETFLRISHGVGGDFTGDGNYYEVGASDGENFYDSVLVPIPPGDIGNWVFITGTYDGTNWNLFRNGELAGSIPSGIGITGGYDFDDGSFNAIGAVDVTNWWTIGSRGVDANFVGQGLNFGGAIDEPAIFTNALTPAQVLSLYNAAEVSPVFTLGLQNPGTVFKGASLSFPVWAEGNATLSYLWKSNGVPLSYTGTNLVVNNIGVGTYTFSVTVSNPYGTNTSSVTFPVINEPPFITTQPVPEERFVGFPFTLSVAAGGTTPFTYIWSQGSTVVQSGSSPSFTAVASLANAGTYTVTISNVTTTNAVSVPVSVIVKSVPSNYPGQVITNGPIAYYRLDETTGTEAFDAIGGNNGTYLGIGAGTVLGVSGYSVVDPDTAVSFEGTNSFIGNISGTAINFTGHTNFTLEVWVNAPAGLPDQSTIIAKGIGNNGTEETEQFALDVYGGSYRFFVSRGVAGGTVVDPAYATDGPNGTWQHIVAVYDDLNTLGGGANMYLYVNGVLEGSNPTLSQGLNSTATPVSIGSKRTGNDPNYDGTFAGTIDEVAIYNYALSPTMITADYASAYGTTLRPIIDFQPVPTTNYVGLPITFSASAYGSFPLTYQWNKNNVAIGGADSESYTIGAVASTDAGSYSVTIMNNVGTTNSVSVPLVVLAAPTNPPFISGLVMHLPFNTNLVDVTGRGNNGAGMFAAISPSNVNTNTSYASNAVFGVTNSVAPATNFSDNPSFYYVSDGSEPLPGTALHYNTDAIQLGTSSSIGTNDYYVSLGVRPDLQFGSNSFTVAYWIRLPQGYNAGDLPFFTDTLQSTGGNGFVFAPVYGYGTASPNPTPTPTNAGNWALSIYGNGAGIRYYGDDEINDGVFHSLVHVIDRTTDKATTYLDGVTARSALIAGTTLNAAGNINVPTGATIGQDPTGLYGESGSADIQDLGVWNRALTPLEAASIYVAATANPANPLSFSSVTTVPLGPITIKVLSASQVQLSWDGSAVLQSATSAAGPYTTIVGATSPYTVSSTGTKFYRTKL